MKHIHRFQGLGYGHLSGTILLILHGHVFVKFIRVIYVFCKGSNILHFPLNLRQSFSSYSSLIIVASLIK